MQGYVICRLEPDTPNGCIYWSGSIACEPGDADGTQMFIGEAVSRHNVLVVFGEEEADGLALWLNTSPVLRRRPETALWQALPVTEFVVRAAKGSKNNLSGRERDRLIMVKALLANDDVKRIALLKKLTTDEACKEGLSSFWRDSFIQLLSSIPNAPDVDDKIFSRELFKFLLTHPDMALEACNARL